jgi:hypothetical protein
MPVFGALRGSGNNTLGIFKYAPPLSIYLKSAAAFSVLAVTRVVNTGVTTVNRNLGVSPGLHDGIPVEHVSGTTYQGLDPIAAQAVADAAAAHTYFAGLPQTGSIAGDMNGLYLPAGVYFTPSAMTNTGVFTLDGCNDPGSVWVFRIGGAYTPLAASRTILVNGALESNVYYVIEGAISTGEASFVVGTLLSPGAITIGNGGHVNGRILSWFGTVTLCNNAVSTA